MEALGEFLPIQLVDGASQVLEDRLQISVKTIGALKQTIAEKYSVSLNALKLYIRGTSGKCRKELSDDRATVEAEVANMQSHEEAFDLGDKVFTSRTLRYNDDRFVECDLSDVGLVLPLKIPIGTEGTISALSDIGFEVTFKNYESAGGFNFGFDSNTWRSLLKPCTIEFSSMQAETIADSMSAMIKAEVFKALAEKDSAIRAKDEEIKAKDEEIKTLKRENKELKQLSEDFVAKRQKLAAATREYANDLDDLQKRIKGMTD